jgi:hypothetical protein
MLDRLMATPRKELVDDVIFYHDGWIAAGRGCNELKAENAKLRDDLETQRETAWHNTKRNAREYKRVRDENDKLRELAKKLKACNSSCGRCIELYGICEHETELRELGVEVD